MRVLFTTPILEHPPAGGPQLRIENSIKALSTQCELYLVARATQRSVSKAGEGLYGSLSRGFYYAPAFAGSRLLRRIRRALLRADRDETHTSAQFIVDLVDRLRIDVVWFGYGNISFPLIREVKAARPDLKTVCDTDSVWSRYVLRELPFEADPVRRAQIDRAGQEKETEERAWVNLCEVTTAVSEVDADYYRAIAREPARIQVFSNAIDVHRYEHVPPAPPDLVHPCMYLAGSFVPAGSPMEVASKWVLEEVLPMVSQQLPDIRLYIVGRGSETISAAVDDPAVVVKGKLPSVLPYLCHADVALVPLKFESGTRFKILEAGACGVPLVSTVLGAEGIPVIHNEHILLADDPLPFAQAIVRLIRDRPLAERLAQNCRELVRERYSIESLSREAARILEYLGGQRRDRRENALG